MPYQRRILNIFIVALTLLFIAPACSRAQVDWARDFDAALKQAAKEKKFIVLDISASW